MYNIDIDALVSESKKDFTRERKSTILDYMLKNNNTVIASKVKKNGRNDSIKIYSVKNGEQLKKLGDYVEKNANIILNKLRKNGIKIAWYNRKNNTITEE